MRVLQKDVDENVQAVKKKDVRKSIRRLPKLTRKLARHAIKGPLAALVAEGYSKKAIFESIRPTASAGRKDKILGKTKTNVVSAEKAKKKA